MRTLAPWLCFVLICCCSEGLQAQAASPDADVVIHPWEDLGEGFIGSYRWPTLLYHASAAIVTPPLVYTLDKPVQTYFQQHNPIGQTFADVTLAIGWGAPVAVPLALYLGGLAGDASELATAGAAALQAAAVQAVVVTALKWLTDRAGPYPNGDPAQERHRGLFHGSNSPRTFNWNPFDFAGGMHWPSGHTAGNIAIVSALVAFYPDEPWIAAVGYPAVLAIAVGMLEGDYHWFSDVVAGALMGHAIGWVIGKHFRERYDAAHSGGTARERTGFRIEPQASLHGAGLQLVYAH